MTTTPAVPGNQPDTVAASAGEVARAALVEQVGAASVGEHLGVRAEGPQVVTHLFESVQAGYPGWRWSVTLSRASGEHEVTVDEVVLLPGDEAILAPVWLPWRERIQPGDLSPGDILPIDEDDTRLVPTYLEGDAEVDEALAGLVGDEVGFGRPRVLSASGRELAAARWYDGNPGPESALAQTAPGRCASCGFLVRLGGSLATLFGVCANEYANDDGRVVSYDHGCGAHSGAQLRHKQLPPPLLDPVFDTLSLDDLERF
ncbi:MAG: DUF3027 domain-containing protein [Actinomycetota bacterium]|nr:DUF3027 domain-containing protein [Actinomycetota bacterium]